MDDQETPPPGPPALPPEQLVWSVSWTFVWAIVIYAIDVLAQLFVGIGVGLFYAISGRMENLNPETLEGNGLILSLLTLGSLPAVLAACHFIARSKRGLPPLEYLGVFWSPLRRWWIWIIFLGLFVAASDFATHLSGRPVVPEFMRSIYESAEFLPLLWVTLMVAAPIGEEVFFRGFIYRGLEFSPLGWLGATVITAAMWAFVHFQYDWVGVTVIFGSGLLLGALRHRTGSVVPCILLHSLMNLIATVELLVMR